MKKIAIVTIGSEAFATGPENAGRIMEALATATPLVGVWSGSHYPSKNSTTISVNLVDALDPDPEASKPKNTAPAQAITAQEEVPF